MGKVKSQMTNCAISLAGKEFRLKQENEVFWEGVLQGGGRVKELVYYLAALTIGTCNGWKKIKDRYMES